MSDKKETNFENKTKKEILVELKRLQRENQNLKMFQSRNRINIFKLSIVMHGVSANDDKDPAKRDKERDMFDYGIKAEFQLFTDKKAMYDYLDFLLDIYKKYGYKCGYFHDTLTGYEMGNIGNVDPNKYGVFMEEMEFDFNGPSIHGEYYCVSGGYSPDTFHDRVKIKLRPTPKSERLSEKVKVAIETIAKRRREERERLRKEKEEKKNDE